MVDDRHRALFEDLGRSLDHWLDVTVRSATNPAADLRWSSIERAFRILQQTLVTPEQRAAFRAVLAKALAGQLNSVMATLDGATQLADAYTVTLVTSDGAQLGPGLNELLVDHLYDT